MTQVTQAGKDTSWQSDKTIFTHLYRAYEEEGTDTKRDDTGLREREHMSILGHKRKRGVVADLGAPQPNKKKIKHNTKRGEEGGVIPPRAFIF